MVFTEMNLNWAGIFAAFFAYYALGALWFALIFNKPYRISLGKGNEPQPAMTPIFFVGPATCTFIVTVTTAILISALRIGTYADAAILSFVVGGGYLVANTFNIAINPNIPRPLLYGAITGAYHLVGILIATVLLVAIGV